MQTQTEETPDAVVTPLDLELERVSDEEWETPQITTEPASEVTPEAPEAPAATAKPAKTKTAKAATPAATPKPAPVPKALADTLKSPKIDRKAYSATEASTTKTIDAAASNALALIPILDSNLDLAVGILPSIAKLDLDGLVAAYNSASSLETAGWITKASVAYNLKERVTNTLTGRATFDATTNAGIAKIAEQTNQELTKFASKLNTSGKTLADYHRIYRNFFQNSPGNGPEGEPVTQEEVFNACRNGIGFSIFVELDRAPEKGKALCIVLDKKLANESVTVLGVRNMVDIMIAAAKTESLIAEGASKPEASAPIAPVAPRARPVPHGGIEKPIAALPGKMVEFINQLTHAANDLATDKDPAAVRYVFINDKGIPTLSADQPVPVSQRDGGTGGVVTARIRKDSFGLVVFLADDDED